MAIQRLLYLYILFVASVSLVSYRKGVCLIWLTLLFIPTFILEQRVTMNLSMLTILLLIPVISEFRLSERRIVWRDFFTNNQNAIFLYFIVSISIVFFSQTVPYGTQCARIIDEIAMLLFSLQTFFLVKNSEKSAIALKRIICSAVIFNIIYCVYFELIVGLNPAGMPLYILLGQGDNEFIVDMIDLETGGLSFRAQTVYRHPLSLGQYMLVLLPLFLMKGKFILNFVFSFIVCALIVLSGSRGALAPMILVVFVSIIKKSHFNLRKFVVFIVAIIVVISFIPNRQWENFTKEAEPFVASLAFWNDEKQKENNITGSSMEMRFNQFDAALVEIEGNPIFGRGYGYRDYYIFRHKDLHPDLLGFESVLLLYLVERGWLGLFFFFVILYFIFKLFKKQATCRTEINMVFIGYLLSIIMTGVRPLTLLFVCLTCSTLVGLSLQGSNQPSDSLKLQED